MFSLNSLDNILLAARPAKLCQSQCICMFCVIVTKTVLATPTTTSLKSSGVHTTTFTHLNLTTAKPPSREDLAKNFELMNDDYDDDYAEVQDAHEHNHEHDHGQNDHSPDDAHYTGNRGELNIGIVLLNVIGTFAVAALAVSIPYFFQKNSRRLISWINCIGAGILLGTCFFHYMPEVREEFENVTVIKHETLKKLQLEIFAVAGFLLILLIEQFITQYFTVFFEEGGFPTHCHDHGQSHHDHPAVSPTPAGDARPEQQGLLEPPTHSPTKSESSTSSTTRFNAIPPADVAVLSVDSIEHHDDHCHEDRLQHSALRSLAFVGSLGIHSIVEGFSLVMLQADELPESAWAKNSALLISICIHKFAVGLTMGFTLKTSKLSRFNAQMALLAFALFTPIGGIIAYITRGSLPDNVIAPLNAIGLGTFFYVLFFEIAPHEFLGSGEKRNKFAKALIVVVGVGLALTLSVMVPHCHGHSHDHNHDH